ncbi:hypothetical protein [Roseiconus lacunae]|uniref:Uncharacterized protein n=1 Tax=Roseiconus lacunae TaxID=2605694 RepID=A0ABT7PEI3_9BACT|nr:hypothetical protein [Roseiconus lacunae]MDM4014636.1 hypothetical protein [Roseiconus lacunae]
MSFADVFGAKPARGKITIDGSSVTGGGSAPTTITLPDHRSGDSWQGLVETEIRDPDGNAIKLGGASITLQIKRRRTDRMPALEFSSATGDIQIVDSMAGVISIGSRQISLTPGVYVFDIQITFSNGDVITPIQGAWVITPDVTRG